MKIKRLPEYKISFENKRILSEIRELLKKYIGNTITFCEFTGILDRDNYLKDYKRDSLLHWRKKFLRKEGEKGRETPKKIVMTLNDFLNFADYLSIKDKIDLQKFKKTLIYCIEKGYLLPDKKKSSFEPVVYRTFEKGR